MASTSSSSAVPRPSTDDDRATLLAPPARDDDAESNTSSIRVNRRYRNRRSSNIEDDDFDRRSIIDILKQPRLLTTLEQGLVILAIVLLCLAAIFGGLALGLKHRVDEGGDDGNGNGDQGGGDTGPIYRTTTLTTTQTQTTTVAGPAPTGLPPQDPPSKNEEVCLTPTCVQISAAILDSIDESVDPCEDFYQFANGNWLAAHPIPPEKGLYGAAQWIDQRNKDLLLRILDTPIDELLDRPSRASTGETGDKEKEEEREADRKNLVDLHTFYSSCMDEDALDRRGAAPLLDVVREVIAAWHGNPEAAASAKAGKKQDRVKRLTDTLALLHAKGIDALFSSYTQGDYRTAPDSMRLWLSQGGIGLPNPEYYADKAVEKVYTEVIRSALSSVYSQLDDGKLLLVSDDEDVSTTKKKSKKGKKGGKGGKGKDKHPAPAPPMRDFTSIFDLETRLSSVFVDSVTLEDPVLAYNAYNLSELQHSLAPFIDWTDYFSSFSPRAFPHPVIVDAPAFVGNLSKIIEKTSDETLEVYFVWKTVQSLANLIGPRERARKEVTQLHNYLSGIDEGVRGRREDVCLQSLLDNYGFLMGRYYVQQAFNGDAKEYAETIIKSAIQAFKDRLPELDWLDDVSRAGAEEKASAIGIKIGYPTAAPDTRSAVALRRYYAGVPSPVKGKYFEAVMDVRTQDERRKWLSVGKAREGWEMVPTEVNAYYQPQANEMVFPAGILQAPYFSKDYPEYLGFGSMASLAGHELTHAFDSAGRQFDKTGKLTDWWTNDTIARYNDLTECIVEQYGEYYMVGPDGRKYHVNSRFTLGEDIADGGGLAQTYRAWSDRFASDPSGEKHDNYILPGLNYTREQLFFIQFARGWARNIKPAEAVRRIRTDEHSPTKFRVIGPLSNSEEFQEAFQCTKKSKMNRKNKCKIW